VWERDTGKEVQKLTGHEGVVTSVAVTPDGRYIVSGSQDEWENEDETVRVWSIDKLK
jgi:WD40 repeat protein